MASGHQTFKKKEVQLLSFSLLIFLLCGYTTSLIPGFKTQTLFHRTHSTQRRWWRWNLTRRRDILAPPTMSGTRGRVRLKRRNNFDFAFSAVINIRALPWLLTVTNYAICHQKYLDFWQENISQKTLNLSRICFRGTHSDFFAIVIRGFANNR